MEFLEATVCAGDGVKHARQRALHIIVTTVPQFGGESKSEKFLATRSASIHENVSVLADAC